MKLFMTKKAIKEAQIELDNHITELKICKIDIDSVVNQTKINGVYIVATGFINKAKMSELDKPIYKEVKGFDTEYLADVLRNKIIGDFDIDYDDLKAVLPNVDFYHQGKLLKKNKNIKIDDSDDY